MYKAIDKLNALARTATFIGLSKRCILMNAFFNCKFSYCPLITMCHSRTNNEKINKVHERCLRLAYNDKQTPFPELLKKVGSVSIQKRNIQSLAVEMCAISRNISPLIMNDNFKQKDNSQYNLRQISEFSRPMVKSVHHGSESFSFLRPKIWDRLLDDYKDIGSLNTLKKRLKNGRLFRLFVIVDSVKFALTI